MANTEDLRPSKRPAHAGRLPVPVLVAIVLAVIAAAVLVAGAALQREAAPEPASFLETALGLPQPDGPRIRKPAADIRVDLADGLVVDRAGARVRITAEGVTGPWERFADGVRRPAPFGAEVIVQKGAFAEHLLEVAERQGRKTWRWQLDTTLDLALRDGEVLFTRKGVDVGYRIFPVRVFDGAGEDVTPAGATWALDRSGRTPVLELELDDAALPLPYVIDPPVAFVRQLGSAANKTTSTTLSFTTTAASTVGDSVFLAVASDNITGGACITATYGGTALTQDSAVTNDPGAGNGARATLFSGHNFPAKASGSTVLISVFQSNCTTAVNIDAKAASLFEFSGLRRTGTLDQSNTGSADVGTGTAVTSSTLTTTWPDALLIGVVAVEGPSGDTFTAGTGFTARTAAGTTGNPAKSNMTVRPQSRITTGAPTGFTAPATITSRDWANAFATYKNGLAANGSGTLTVAPTTMLAGTTGTLTFTYTAATYGMENGTLDVTFPANWTAPTTTPGTPGYTTATGGAGANTISWNSGTRVLTVSGVTLTNAQTLTIAYGTGAGGAATAPGAAQAGASTFSTTQFSGDNGAAAAIATSPTVTVTNSADGSGTMSSSVTNAAASSTGNTLAFTYTAAAGGLNNGAVRVTAPTGWSAPALTTTAAGYTTASTGTVGVAGQVITVTGVTLDGGQTMTITYGSTAGGGPGATATATTGAATWTSAERSTAGGTITNLAASPSVTVNAARGSGTLTTPTTNVAASSSGNTLTFTYTAATGGMSGGAVRVTVPTGWSAPSLTGTAAGYTTASTGTVGVAGQVITVTGVTLAAAATMTITYGSTGSGGPGATATATTGAATWQGAQDSVGSTTLTNLGASPSVTVNSARGSGTLTTPTTNVAASSSGNTLTFTYTAATGGMSGGAVRVTVPTGWSAPSLTGTAAGYTTASTGTVGVAGQVITVTGVTLAGSSTMTITYGSTGSGGPGATATATTGAATWQGAQDSVGSTSLVNLGASPSVTVNSARGSGTLTTPTVDAAASATGNTLTFTYTAGTGGMSGGAVRVTVPTGWSAPSLTGTAAGYTTASTGTVGVSGQQITVTGVTLAGSSTMTITYGSTGSGGPGATATATTGAATWQGAQDSVGSTTLTNLGASPSVTVYAADGTGTLTIPATEVAASAGGNTLTFTYTAATGGISNGAVRVTVPTGWSAPSLTGTAAGYTTASTGTVGVSGQQITVTGVTLAGSSTMTITYGSTAGGGPGATAGGTTGAVAWQGAARSVAGSTITNLGASPSVTVYAADGSGTLATGTTNVAASSSGNTLTFTYTAATGGISNGAVRVTVPAGWSAPSLTGTNAGYTTASTGTVGVAGQVITVTGVTLAAAATMTITYGSTAGGGPGATASASTGAQTWQAAGRSLAGSTITNLGGSPSVTVNAADGAGTLTTGTTSAANGSAGNTLTFTYTAATGGISNGAVRVTVPTGWSAPSLTGTAAGYTTASTGTVGVAGQQITVTGVTLAAAATMTITYGSTGSGGPGATATTSAGAQTWQAADRAVAASSITNLAASPFVTVLAADGSGTLTTPTTDAVNGAAGNTLTFTYTAATGGISNGVVRVTVPAGWSAPSLTGTNAGYTTASTGTVGVAGQQITVTGVTLAAATTMTITYGSTAGGGPGATATTSAGAQTWQAAARSSSAGTITNLGASPSVNVYAADGSGTLGASPTSTAAGSTGNTFTFTYTAATGGISDGAVRVTVPTGWSAPSLTGIAAGYTTASTGTVGVSGQQITVTGVTLAGSSTMTITYGSTAGGGPGATATTSAGAQTWQAAARSSAGGTIANLGASPGVTVTPGALADFLVEAAGGGAIATQTAGTPFSIRVTARDAYGNTVTSFDGAGNTVDISSTGTLGSGSGTTPAFTNGVLASHSVSITSAGSRTLTATRTSGGAQSGTSGSFTVAPAGGATLQVSAPATATAGSTFSVTVTAQDAYGNVATGYTGTVAFSGGGAGAQLPADYTFTGGDAGVKSFSNVELRQAGSRTLTATDTVTGTITGNVAVTVNPAAAVVLDLSAPASSTAGSTFSVTVTALDSFGNTASGYTGTIAFSGGGTGAQLPADYTFTGGDAGVKTFSSVELRQAGSRTITATDTVTGTITGADTLTVTPAAAATLDVATPANAVAGQPFSVTVTALDAYGNTATGYTGTAAFSATGGGETLPGDATFLAGDSGSKVVSGFSFSTPGAKSVIATDTVTGSVTGSGNVTVNPAGVSLSTSSFAAAPTAVVANGSSTSAITLQLKDALGNDLSGSDGAAYAFTTTAGSVGAATDNGDGTVSATLTSSTTAVTATVSGTRNGSPFSGSVDVTFTPGPAVSLDVSAPASATAGSTFSVTVTARDANGNVATGYTGTIAFSGGGSGAQLPADHTFTGGDAGVKTFTSVELRQAGSRTITATDTVTGTITGNANVTVTPATATTLDVSAPASATAGSTFPVTVTARDAYGNTATGYTGTIAFSGGGSGAQLPADYTFTGGDAGTKTFSTVELRQAGSRTLTATDTVTGTITGNAAVTVNPAAAVVLDVSAPASATAGSTFPVTVTARDAYGNTATGYTGTIAFTGGGTGAQLPADYTFTGGDAGTKTFSTVELRQAGSRTITATDTVTGTISGADTLTVTSAAAASLDLAAPASATAGSTFPVTVTALDAYGNTATGYTGTIAFTGGGSGAQLPADYTFTGGDAGTKTFSTVELRQAGSRTITATDTVTGTITGNANITVTAGAASLTTSPLTAAPTALLADGSSTSTVTLQLRDAFGNDLTAPDGSTISFGTDLGSVSAATDLGDGRYEATLTSSTTAGVASVTATRNAASFAQSAAVTFAAGPAATLDVVAPASATAGSTFSVTVTARDANGNVATGYTGTIAFSGGGTGAQLPADYTFTGGDAGVKTFTTAELRQAGSRTITATDTVTGTITGAATLTVTPAAATTLDVSAPASSTAGSTFSVTVTALDAYGNTATAYTGTIAFSGGGTGAQLPADYTFTGGDAGTKTFTTVELRQAGSRTVTATDTVTGTITGNAAVTVNPGGAATLDLSAPASSTAGSTFSVTVTAKDAYANIASGYTGTVAFSGGGAGAQLPADYTFTGGDAGVKSFSNVELRQAGSRTLTATDTVTGTITGNAAVTVNPAAAVVLDLSAPASSTAGSTFSVTVTALDSFGNTASGYTGTIAFSGGGTGAQLPADYTFTGGDAGVKTFSSVELRQAGSRTITATDTVTGTITGNANVTVTPATATTLDLSAPASATAGSTFTVTVTARDSFGNTASGYTGTIAFSGGGTGAQLPADYTFTGSDAGVKTFSTVELRQAGSRTLTATDTVTGTITGNANITVTAGAGTQITLSETGSTTAGDGHQLTATIRDAHGNPVTSDNSTAVTFAKVAGAGTVSGLGAVTAAAGVAVANVTNRLAGSIDLEAQAAGLTAGSATYAIVTGPVSDADSTVVASPGTVVNNGTDTATVTVTLRDAGGNPIPGKTVTLDQGAGSSSISGGGATNASGVVTFTVSSVVEESVTYTATDTTDTLTLSDTAAVNYVFDDLVAPTNAITLASATGAFLSGTTLWYRPSAAGSFSLSSTVADAGSGPGSATYPLVTRSGWTHAAETVTTPAGGPYASSAFTWTNAASGDFDVVVTAADAWVPANTSDTTLNVTEDSTAPAASILCDGGACSTGWVTASPVSVTLSAPDSGSGLDLIRYTTDGTEPTVFTGNVYLGAFPVAAEGATTVKYRAFDRVGNDSGVQSQLIRIDTVDPNTTIDASPAAATQDTTPTFAFSADEAGATFQFRLDGGAWGAATSPLTLGPLAESTYTFEVRATDVAGNVDASPASFTFTVDTTPANTTITSSPPAATSSTSASFSFTASDAGPGFECRLDGGAFADCSSPQSYTGLSEAPHTFEVRAEDAAGNLDPTPATHAWTVDLTAPNTSFLSTPANPSANATPTFGLGSTETPSTFECDLDGGGWSPCSTPFTTPALGDGSHTLKARATDVAGNTDASEVTFTWLVDATAPTGSITSPANGTDIGGSIVLASDSADTGGSGVATVVFQRSPASVGTWTNQASSWDTTGVADGDYDLRVVTTDNAGNAFTSAAITVTVDNTEPALSVVAPNPVNLGTADPAAVSATATDDGSGIANVRFDQCAEDSPACLSDSWILLGVDTGAPYQASWPIPSDGPRLLRVRATDNAGKQKTELVLITIDRIRPGGSLTTPAAGANVRGASVALAASAADTAPGAVNTVTFQRSPAGAGTWVDMSVDSAAPYTGTFDTTAVADGLYDLRVFTTDAAGNAEAAPATIQVRVDNTLPTGAVTSPAAGADVRGTIALTSSSADAGSGVATVQFQRSPAGAGTWTNQSASLDTTALADGQYDLRVTTTDNAGNAFTSAPITIRVDNTLPTGTVTAPAAGADVRGTIALTSSSADAGSGVAAVQFQRSPAGAGTWTNQSASLDTTALADGQYDLRVTTTDNAGNAFTSAPITIRVDNTLPTGTVTAPANGAEIGVAPVALTSNSADAGGSGVATVVFERSPAGAGTWTPTAATWDTASGPDAVADGSYDLRVRTTDNAGNVFVSAAVTVLVDHTAPTTTASLAPGTPSNAPVTVSFSANDGAGSGVSVTSYRVDGGSLQLGTAVVVPAPGDNSNDGAHLVEFFSTDEVGNVESLKNVTVVIDTTAPSGSGGDPGASLRGIANLTYSTAAGDVSSVQFQFSPAGAGAWSNVGAADIAPPYEASWNTTLVADGPYDLRAVVTDTTGNVANTLLPGLPKTVDNTAPAGSVTAPISGAYVSGSIAVDASASDGAVPPASGVSAVRFEVKPAGAGAYSVFGTQTVPVVGSTYRQTLATTGLADGPAELRVVVTDVAGNETTSAPSTVNVDNVAPVVTLDDPGAAVGASVNLTASSSADTADVTFRYRPVGNLGAGTAIGSDATAPFGVTWTTTPAAEQQWELIAVATDGGGNVTTSAPRTVLVDRTQPTGSVTAPASGATVGGPAVALGAAAADAAGSGVALVEWQVKVFGAGSFSTVASDTTAPFDGVWNSTAAPDGAAEVRALVTDAAGNVRTTAVIPVTVDSSGPSVTLTDPGAVLSGTVALAATTGGGAVRVEFSVSPADAGSWTQVADDASAPFGAAFDTAALADGLYDLRAIGFDTFGNPSTPSIREDVRLDNTAPRLVSAAPADGSVSASANQIVLTASEPVTASGALLDGAPAPAPAISGNQLTFATGALADGLHVLTGELEDASGARIPFRVAVTIESAVGADRPPVELSARPDGTSSLVAPGSLASVAMPAAAWPSPPAPSDFVVLRVDLAPPAPVLGMPLLPGTQLVEVTARWALAGTAVTTFDAPIEILIPNPSGEPTLPATSEDGTSWRSLPLLQGQSLPAGQRDGWYRDAAGVHILTRHLTWFALARDGVAPTEPTGFAGVVAEDGLTLRWVPGTDGSGQLGNVLLWVNGEGYREFGPTEFEAKLGPFAAGDTRSFTLIQKDAAGNASRQTAPLRAVPALTGKTLDEAAAALGAAGFTLGTVSEEAVATAPAGTVVEPAGIRLALASSPIDLVVARGAAAPQTRLAFSVAGSNRIALKKKTAIAVRIKVSKPAQVTVTLRNAAKRKLHTWKLKVKAGANVVKLRLPAQVRRPGRYSLTWVARSGTETISRSVAIVLIGPPLAQAKQTRDEIEIVLAGRTPPGDALEPGRAGMPRRISSASGADEAFDLVASAGRETDVVVVDADAYGSRFIVDLRTVFPNVSVIAISREPARRTQSVRAGAALALPRSTTARQLAKAIVAIAGR